MINKPMTSVPDPHKDQSPAVRLGQNAISAVKLSQQLTAEIDAWAEAHRITRSDAIRQLLELGLKAQPASPPPHQASVDPTVIEQNAARQVERLLDPSLPPEERERRIRRLIEGPPEFSRERIDLPKYPR
jgi:ribbon-helix-helix CopG family protein